MTTSPSPSPVRGQDRVSWLQTAWCFLVAAIHTGFCPVLASPADCQPQILVRGKSVYIQSPGNTPTGNDDTAFFDVGVCGSSASHVFQIVNPGPCPLTIQSLVSSNPSEFIVGAPTLPITIPGGGGWLDLPITFDPTSTGVRTSEISITAGELSDPLRFNINGTGVGSPTQFSLSCPSNKTVLCGTAWDFDTPSATATAGTAAPVSVVQTVTNSLCPFVITRTWQAVDACGNTLTCSQSVTIANAQTATLTVPGNANIFGAGLPTPPNPGGQGPGVLPILHSFSAGPGQVLTFPSISGVISLTTGHVSGGPDGYSFANLGTAIASYGGISGIQHDLAGFLVGVFLDANTPPPTAPPILDFRGAQIIGTKPGTNFSQLAPQLGQTFFIGDGLTDNGSGALQQFLAPPTATRLFLGFADGNGYQGPPGVYQDNDGSFLVNLLIQSNDTTILPTNKVVQCDQRWRFDPPILSNSCNPAIADLTPTVVSTVDTGSCPKTSTRTWQWSDTCGTTHFASQTVTLIDTVKPVIVCPDRRFVVALDNKCQLIIPALRPEASDNCTPSTQLIYTQSPAAGSIAAGHCQAVTVVVTDACGNASECSIMVCGEDRTPPRIQTPARVTAVDCKVPNILAIVTAVDNCTASADLILTQAPTAGTLLGPGSTTVSVTATDSAGNTTTVLVPLHPAAGVSFLDQLYNTGVDALRAPLPNSAIDPHYNIVSVPTGTPTGAGAFNAPDSRVGPSFLGLPPFSASRWINPSGNSLQFPSGFYVFTHKFVLPSDLDPGTASISGRWAADMGGKIFINSSTNPAAVMTLPALGNYWPHWHNFTIASGFLPWPATNTLTFAVESLERYPALRVEFTNAFATCASCAPPVVLLQSPDITRPRLGSATFSATVWGSPAMNYQWFFNGTPLTNNTHYSGVNTPTLTIAPLHYGDAGIYHMLAANDCGRVTTRPRKLTVSKGWAWPWEGWMFNEAARPLSGVFGHDLVLTSSSSIGPRQTGISVGDTSEFALPQIGGRDVPVLHRPQNPPDSRLRIPSLLPSPSSQASSSPTPSAGATIILDVFIPTTSLIGGDSNLTLFARSVPPEANAGAPTAGIKENALVLSVDGSQNLRLNWTLPGSTGSWISTASLRSNQWNRIGMSLDSAPASLPSAASPTPPPVEAAVTLFLNGLRVGQTNLPTLSTLLLSTNADNFIVSPTTSSVSPEPSDLQDVYVAGIQYHAIAFSPDLMTGMGDPEQGPLSLVESPLVERVAVAPKLSARVNRASVVLTWMGTGYRLEETSDPVHGPWNESYLPFSQCCDSAENPSETPDQIDESQIQSSVTIAAQIETSGVPTPTSRFYRLRAP